MLTQTHSEVVKAFRDIDTAYDLAVRAGAKAYGDSMDLDYLTLSDGNQLKGEISRTESSAGDDRSYELIVRVIDPATNDELSNAYIEIGRNEILEAKRITGGKDIGAEESIEIVNSVASALRKLF